MSSTQSQPNSGHGPHVRVLHAGSSDVAPHMSCFDLWGDLTEEEALELAIRLSQQEEQQLKTQEQWDVRKVFSRCHPLLLADNTMIHLAGLPEAPGKDLGSAADPKLISTALAEPWRGGWSSTR